MRVAHDYDYDLDSTFPRGLQKDGTVGANARYGVPYYIRRAKPPSVIDRLFDFLHLLGTAL